MANRLGEMLREYRLRAIDRSGKQLTQEKLAIYLEHVVKNIASRSAIVSKWESGSSRPDRELILGIIKVLHSHGGIQSPNDANRLLQAGDYHPLSRFEQGQIFERKVRKNPLFVRILDNSKEVSVAALVTAVLGMLSSIASAAISILSATPIFDSFEPFLPLIFGILALVMGLIVVFGAAAKLFRDRKEDRQAAIMRLRSKEQALLDTVHENIKTLLAEEAR